MSAARRPERPRAHAGDAGTARLEIILSRFLELLAETRSQVRDDLRDALRCVVSASKPAGEIGEDLFAVRWQRRTGRGIHLFSSRVAPERERERQADGDLLSHVVPARNRNAAQGDRNTGNQDGPHLPAPPPLGSAHRPRCNEAGARLGQARRGIGSGGEKLLSVGAAFVQSRRAVGRTLRIESAIAGRLPARGARRDRSCASTGLWLWHEGARCARLANDLV